MESKDYEKKRAVGFAAGYTYRKLLRMNLTQDCCMVLKSSSEGWQPGEGPVTQQLEQFARGGSIHPEDAERFIAFTRLENLRAAFQSGQEVLSLIYRRRAEDAYRWNLMEVVPDEGDAEGNEFVILCVKDIHNALRESEEREGTDVRRRQREEVWRQTLEDRSYIISSLSSLFFSTYYIDVESDSFRAVIQLRWVEDVLGEEVNYSAALQIYANHFIHPEDRAEYLRVMNARNLRETLRWWQPCVAVEYRRLPEDPAVSPGSDGWVRATAVLARTGEDDMPKTVVYVAQDISSNRYREKSDG